MMVYLISAANKLTIQYNSHNIVGSDVVGYMVFI